MATHHCMLAHKFNPTRIKEWPVVVEPKLDGVRCLATVDHGTVKFLSRAGKPFTSFDHLAPSLLAASDALGMARIVFDGEMVSGTFRDSVSQARRKETPALDAVFHVFDVFNDAVLHAKLPYRKRREWLLKTALNLTPAVEAASGKQIHAYYYQFRMGGYEGAIVKDPAAPYELKRSFAWMKMKAEESVDVPVTGRFEGEGKYAGKLGGLLVDFNGVEVGVGTGLTDAQREEFWQCKESELLGRLVEVNYHEITPDGSLRHPRFIRFRDTLEHGTKE